LTIFAPCEDATHAPKNGDQSMLVKVGNYRLNLNRLLFAHDSESNGCLWLTFAGAGETPIQFHGPERRALLKHLDRDSIDLSKPPSPADLLFAEYRDKGGTMARSTWESKRESLRFLTEQAETHKPGQAQLKVMGELEAELLL
jgi:hypothetical protein